MSFNVQKFREVKHKHRVKEVEVPQLKAFFEPDEKPVIKIRNLEGAELAECNEAITANRALKATISKLMSANASQKAEAICESLGITDKVPDDMVRRINMLKFGMVEPTMEKEDVVRFAAMFPVVFYDLTNQIIDLTGQGVDLGE